jgi:predicted TIM-barrel fold metal-dependent hydrolase
VRDSELLTSLCSTYNDWLAEFFTPFPERIKGIAMLNVDDVSEGVKELERCANMGLAGGMITVYPHSGRGYYLPEYDVLWAAAQHLDMPLGLRNPFAVHGRLCPGPSFVRGLGPLGATSGNRSGRSRV